MNFKWPRKNINIEELPYFKLRKRFITREKDIAIKARDQAERARQIAQATLQARQQAALQARQQVAHEIAQRAGNLPNTGIKYKVKSLRTGLNVALAEDDQNLNTVLTNLGARGHQRIDFDLMTRNKTNVPSKTKGVRSRNIYDYGEFRVFNLELEHARRKLSQSKQVQNIPIPNLVDIVNIPLQRLNLLHYGGPSPQSTPSHSTSSPPPSPPFHRRSASPPPRRSASPPARRPPKKTHQSPTHSSSAKVDSPEAIAANQKLMDEGLTGPKDLRNEITGYVIKATTGDRYRLSYRYPNGVLFDVTSGKDVNQLIIAAKNNPKPKPKKK